GPPRRWVSVCPSSLSGRTGYGKRSTFTSRSRFNVTTPDPWRIGRERPSAAAHSPHAFYRRRRPAAINNLRARGIESHRYSERAFRRRGQPVPLLVLPRILRLNVQVERPVVVVLESIPVANREAIDRIGALKAVLFIHRR